MEEMGHLDPKAVDWLSDKPLEHWSRSHFNCFPKCDMLLNNICETFNSCILEAREKPILTMLEWIREFIMTRLSDNRDRARKKWSGKKICPRIRKIVEKNIDKAADCIPIKSDDWNYEISSYDGSRYVVNLQEHTCTCKKWDLTGIRCNHGMSAICSPSLEPEDFVNLCYSVETFLEVYKDAILPVNGPQLWTKTGLIPPLPPNFERRSGRPSRARRVEHDEPANKGKKRHRGQKKQPIRLKRQPYQVICHYCGGTGHNQKGCERKKIDHPTTYQDANSNDQTTTTKLTQSKKRKGVEVQATNTTSSANVPLLLPLDKDVEARAVVAAAVVALPALPRLSQQMLRQPPHHQRLCHSPRRFLLTLVQWVELRWGLVVHKPRPDRGIHHHHQRHYFPTSPKTLHQPPGCEQSAKNKVNWTTNSNAAATVYCGGSLSFRVHKRKMMIERYIRSVDPDWLDRLVPQPPANPPAPDNDDVHAAVEDHDLD
ncbi:UNVERIFIED_CONTAM: hypothetical protein Sradi_5415500 [Sesamum radiatum]|uniref:SWIM-type domain-containing protein n=1 Tax=Sesamum radiatum TaxID=300843 RepID=A0AAW2L974_SESRA